MLNEGKNKLFIAEAAYRRAALYEVFQNFKDLLSEPLTTRELAQNFELKESCLERFLHAATSIYLIKKLPDGRFLRNEEAPTYKAEPSLILFYLIEKNIPDFLLANVVSYKELAEHFFTEKSFSEEQILQTGLLIRTEEGNIEVPSDIIEFLSKTEPNYIGPRILHHKTIMYPMFQKDVIWEALRTGVSQWRNVFGLNVSTPFDIYKDQPEILNIFTEGLHQLNKDENGLLLVNKDLSQVKSVLDVGGGSGSFTIAVLEKQPNILQAEIYELSGAIECLEMVFKKYAGHHVEKVRYRPGSFFEDIPCGLQGLDENDRYDLIILGWILHDWNDESCLKILSRVRHHLAPQGQLFIIEAILPDDKLSLTVTISDMAMLLQTEGKERTFEEYKSLLLESGFSSILLEPQSTRRQIIEAR